MMIKEEVIIKRVINKKIKLTDNAMLKHRPNLFDEWDFDKNDELGLDIYKITKSNGKKAWWICPKGHSHIKKISNKVDGIGCPVCSNKQLLVGYNDMWTTNPELAKLLADSDEGYKYMQASKIKANWKCNRCGSLIEQRAIYSIKKQGLSCAMCSDGIDYPEKFMFHLLKQLGFSFQHDNSLSWSGNKRYDFYLPDINCIIETHGEQHKRKTSWSRGLNGEHENDLFKKELALENGIEHYIEIDCGKSEMSFMKEEISKSLMSELFNLDSIDWISIEESCSNSAMIEACKLFNKGFKIFEISKSLKLNKNAISGYLVRGNNIGLCIYVPSEIKRKVVQLDLDNNFIRVWDSMKDAGDYAGVSSNTIGGCCSNRRKTSGGYKWLYLEDYNDYIEGVRIPKTFKNLHGCSVAVVKLDKDSNFLAEYESIKEAASKNNLNGFAHVTSCCKGNRKTAYGFKWMYKEDYEKNII